MVRSLSINSGSFVSEAYYLQTPEMALCLFIGSCAARGYSFQFAPTGIGAATAPASADFVGVNNVPFGATIPTAAVVHSGAGLVWGFQPIVPTAWMRIAVSTVLAGSQSLVVF